MENKKHKVIGFSSKGSVVWRLCSSSTTLSHGSPRLVLVLDEVSPCLRHFCQCLGDVVGGHALGFEIQDHAFFIVTPKDAINEIIPTRPQDMDRAHGALLPSAQGSIFLSCFAGIVSRNIPCL